MFPRSAALAGLAVLLLALGAAAQDDRVCCIPRTDPPAYPGFDCSQLVPLGADRCNMVYGGEACIWTTGDKCPDTPQEPRECTRLQHFEYFGDKRIRVDVGRCAGPCGGSADAADKDECKPSVWGEAQLEDGTSVRVIKACECKRCRAEPARVAVEVPAGECAGVCPEIPRPKPCTDGVEDNFAGGNLETPSPSAALITNVLSSCSAGIQTSYDQFVDNRCFGTTIGCLAAKSPCPLARAVLSFCVRAANVPLTSTDSIIIGFNGIPVWSRALNAFEADNLWSPGDELCTGLDLSALPTGGAPLNVLSTLQAVGNVDFAVQDDTAVDFVRLQVAYEDCLACLPSEVTVNSIYTAEGVASVRDVRDCRCTGVTDCQVEPLYETFYPNTIFQTTVNVGQCAGGCAKGACRPVKRIRQLIKAPEGQRAITVIKACRCFEKVVLGDDVPVGADPGSDSGSKAQGGKP